MGFRRWMNFRPQAEADREPRVITRPLTDKIKPTVDERTAMAAVQLIENEAFERVLDRLRGQRLATISQSGEEMHKTREIAYQGLRAIDQICDDIQAMADDLKLHSHAREAEEF